MSPLELIGAAASTGIGIDDVLGLVVVACFAGGALYGTGRAVLEQFYPGREGAAAKPSAEAAVEAAVEIGGEDRSHERFVKNSREYNRRERLEREEAAQRELREAEAERIAFEQQVMLDFIDRK